MSICVHADGKLLMVSNGSCIVVLPASVTLTSYGCDHANDFLICQGLPYQMDMISITLGSCVLTGRVINRKIYGSSQSLIRS